MRMTTIKNAKIQKHKNIEEAEAEFLKHCKLKNLREQTVKYYECFLLGKHTVERVCSGLSPLRRDRLWC